jgi:hypothetical protein
LGREVKLTSHKTARVIATLMTSGGTNLRKSVFGIGNQILVKCHILLGMSEGDGKNNLNVCVGCKAEVRCDDEDVVVEEAGMGCDGVDMK